MMKKVLCVGHAAYDITLPVDKFLEENKKVRITEQVECGGGASANAAYLLAKWGMDVSFAGIIGDDLYGSKIESEFLSIGCDTTYLKKSKSFDTTVSYIIANSSNGSRTIIVKRSKNLDEYFKTDEDNLVDEMKSDIILVDGEELELSKKVLKNNKNAISILDAGNLKPSIVELGHLVTYLVCSLDFANEYTGNVINLKDARSIIPIYEKLVQDFKTNVVITLGSAGSFTQINNKYVLIPSLKVKAIDSTAAGDIFHGAFTYFIANGYNLIDTIRLANITGALSVTKLGGKNSMPDLEEVLRIGGLVSAKQ